MREYTREKETSDAVAGGSKVRATIVYNTCRDACRSDACRGLSEYRVPRTARVEGNGKTIRIYECIRSRKFYGEYRNSTNTPEHERVES